MVKLIGMLLIAISLLSLVTGAWIDFNYSTSPQITGNAVTNILTQAPVSADFFSYLAAVAFSFSIISFIMGVVFLFRV